MTTSGLSKIEKRILLRAPRDRVWRALTNVEEFSKWFGCETAGVFEPGARVGIVDQERPTAEHGTPIELLRCELAAVGYRVIATYQLAGDGGYLAVIAPPELAGRKSPREIVACPDRDGAR